MAKGNMLQGQARGAVGDVVFQVLKGQQVSKVRNRQPANPKTQRQMEQRSLFISPVKFYKQSQQSIFKFAYEDKKANESDYNAFMRHNAGNGVNISKAVFDAVDFPAIGKWTAAKGSLIPTTPFLKDDEIRIPMATGYEQATTIGELYALIAPALGLVQDDILTFAKIGVKGMTGSSTPSVDVDSEISSAWGVTSIKVDFNDETTLQSVSNYIGNIQVFQTSTTIRLVNTLEVVSSQDAVMGTCVHSRITPNGLKVSDATFVLNNVANAYWAKCHLTTYVDAVVASWGATEQSILEGSLVE